MPRERSISIQSDTTPAAPALAVHGARLADHLGVQRQCLGQGRLAGVGVRDDGEGAASGRFHPVSSAAAAVGCGVGDGDQCSSL